MSAREYLEVTLHTKGGGQIVVAMTDISSQRNILGDGYTSLKWTSTGWDDLPKLHSVDLPSLAGISVRQIVEPSGELAAAPGDPPEQHHPTHPRQPGQTLHPQTLPHQPRRDRLDARPGPRRTERIMTQATRIKELVDWRGDAALYRMEPPHEGNEYVVVSAVDLAARGFNTFGDPRPMQIETYIFPADENGEVANYSELSGSQKGTLNHADALRSAGYEVTA